MSVPVRLRLLAPLLLLLSACASSTGSRQRGSDPSLVENVHNLLRDRELATSLSAAALASDRGQMQLPQYNAAVEKFVVALQKRLPVDKWSAPVRIELPDRSYLISFDPAPADLVPGPVWPPSFFTRLIPAAAYKISEGDHHAPEPGIGFPVVLAMEDVDRIVKERAFRPRVGVYVPGTATLEFGRAASASSPIPIKLRIHNTYEERKAEVAGSKHALACNISAAVHHSLDNRYIRNNALFGLLRPDMRQDDIGLFGLNVYDPKKIPVVFVHGLKSAPHIWKNAVNEIYHDPVLSEHYQPVLFLYPSGLSVPASAERLRHNLQAYRDHWDSDHNDPGMSQMVLVGHSMGGILSRLQVIDSGDDLRKAFFSRPVSEVPWLSDDQAAAVENALIFEHQPYVKRAVFVAVPHRGSRIADLGIVRFAIRLIKLPVDAITLASTALLSDTSMLNPALLSYNMIGLRSVDMLSPGHPYFKAMEKRPILVPFHSIIGSRGRGTLPDVSDGIVPYSSAHLDGAQSELIVPYSHSCTEKTETVQEILRILRIHAAGKN